MGWELPLDAFHTNSSFGPGTFPLLPFARDFAKLTNCAKLPLVQNAADDRSPPIMHLSA